MENTRFQYQFDGSGTGKVSIQELAHKGILVVPSVISERDADSLCVAIQQLALEREGDAGIHAMRQLHQSVSEVRDLISSSHVTALVQEVLGSGAFAVRSIFFDKTASANWKVAWHQDLTIAVEQRVEVPGFGPWSVKEGIVHVQPPVAVLEKMLTLRIHLDECMEENGPLQVLPGSHLHGRLSAEQISEFRKRLPCVTCLVPKGGAVVMKPLLLHASSQHFFQAIEE